VSGVRDAPSTAGLRRIVAFNRPKLIVATALSVASWTLVVSSNGESWIRWAALLLAVPTTYFLIASPVASWYLYDHSRLYEWRWLRPLLPSARGPSISLTVGFDGAEESLAEVVGQRLTVVDIAAGCVAFSQRLRQLVEREAAQVSVRSGCQGLPLRGSTVSLAVLAFSAHEIHDDDRCVNALTEVRRVLSPTGRLILVEHVRDVANVSVFGPAAWHFRSESQWCNLAARAGLRLDGHVRYGGLVHAFAFEL